MDINDEFLQLCASHLGSVISNTSGPKIHPGILYAIEYRINPATYETEGFIVVAHNHPDLGSAGMSYYDAYWNDHVRFEAVYDTGSVESVTVLQNVDTIVEMSRPYDWQKWNCQHFVTAALGLVPKSVQVEGLGQVLSFAAAVVVGGVILSSIRSSHR
jgi:hypothetical protein